VLALLKFMRDFDWAGAEAEFKLALELSPSAADIYDHYGWLCGALGRHDEAVALIQRAQELDPMAHRADIASALLRAGRYAEAVEAGTRCIEFEPGYARGHATLGWAYFLSGLRDEGIRQLEQAAALSPEASTWLAQLGQAMALVGRTEAARGALRQLEALSRERYVSPYHFAYVHTGLGEPDTALLRKMNLAP